ncbi:hypothetical protein OYV_08150, partial ['Chrysanthemum coronarium' phytoplasma]
MAKKIIKTKKNQSKSNKKSPQSKNNKTTKTIIKRKTPTPKIIIATQTQKENWFFKIIKNFFNILVYFIPLL